MKGSEMEREDGVHVFGMLSFYRPGVKDCGGVQRQPTSSIRSGMRTWRHGTGQIWGEGERGSKSTCVIVGIYVHHIAFHLCTWYK
jgi:hypothetical protein